MNQNEHDIQGKLRILKHAEAIDSAVRTRRYFGGCRRFMLLAAEAMIPVLMDLGGPAPVLIDENVDHNEIAQLVVNWKFRMAGQFCSAPSRFLVHSSKYEGFVESITAKVA